MPILFCPLMLPTAENDICPSQEWPKGWYLGNHFPCLSITILSQSANRQRTPQHLTQSSELWKGTWDVLSVVPVSNDALTIGNYLQNCLDSLYVVGYLSGIQFGPLLFMLFKVDTKHKISLGVSGPWIGLRALINHTLFPWAWTNGKIAPRARYWLKRSSDLFQVKLELDNGEINSSGWAILPSVGLKVYPMRQDVRNRANMTPVKMKIESELGIGKEKGKEEKRAIALIL